MKNFKRIFGAVALGVAALTSLGNIQEAKADSLPDLIVRSVDLYPTGKCGPLGSAIAGDVVIKNRGRARARALIFTPLISVYDKYNKRFKDADVKINSLAPGESTRVRVNIGRLKSKRNLGGLRKIIIHVDPRDKIRETNELNNTFAVRVPVFCR